MKKLLILLLIPVFASAHTGAITGKVVDAASGEDLAGANVLLVGSLRGAAADREGNFLIEGVEPGTYTVRFSKVGYATRLITGVEVAPEARVRLDAALDEESHEEDEVVVTGLRRLGTEAALLADRRRAAAIGDGVSTEQMRRSGDATSGDALRRVTGISVVDGKFVFIRGVTDRYNTATLDGAPLGGTEAGKRSFSFDMVPSGLLENIRVVKSAAPDLPGDFSGGLVQLNTRDFPGGRILAAGFSAGYNTATTGRSILRSAGGHTDWLGLDDGSRAHPGGGLPVGELASRLANTWAPATRSAPVNGSWSLAWGDEISAGEEGKVGLLGSLSYRRGFQRTETETRELFAGGGVLRSLAGVQDRVSVLWGGMGGLTWQVSPLHTLSLKTTHARSAEDEVIRTAGEDNNTGNEVRTTAVIWTERSTSAGVLSGDHRLPWPRGSAISWRGTFSASRREDPDRKLVPYVRSLGSDPAEPFMVTTSDRSWETLNDRVRSIAADFSTPAGDWRLKGGLLAEERAAAYDIRAYRIEGTGIADYALLLQPIESVYRTENFGPGRFRMFANPNNAASSYEGTGVLSAAYFMLDVPLDVLSEGARVTGGARLERSRVNLSNNRSGGGAVSSVDRDDADILPSLHLVAPLAGATHVRLAYSHTVNRPEFRELSEVAYYDYRRLETIFGNPDLQRALVRNADVRLEMFPGGAQVLALSYFHKNIAHPIEESVLASSTPIRQWFNSARAENSGWELEFRLSLGFLGGGFGSFLVSGNYARIFSSVRFTDPETGREASRPMQGQAPSMLNLGIHYSDPDGETSVSLLYNRNGRRIDAVGSLDEDDIYEEPRDLVDLSVSRRVSSFLELAYSVRNLTGRPETLTRRGQFYRRNTTGTTHSLSASVSL
ncbi:MAG: carboxypeptidase-like regulatory domain-containing protein [Bacteroidota bacterium]